MSEFSDHPLARSRWGVVVLASLVIFGPIAIDLYLPAMPQIGRQFAVDSGAVQWTLSAFLAGFCLGMLVYGPVSDAVGRRPVLLFGIVLFLVASVMCALAPNVGWLIAARFFQAVGGGAPAVMSRTIVRDIFPRHDAARVLSMVALVTALTPMLAPLIGGQILTVAPWPVVFAVLAAYAALVLLVSLRTIPESYPVERRSGLRLGAAMAIYGRLATDRAAWGCVLAAGGSFAAMFAYIAGTPFVYIDYFGVPPQAYGLLFAANIVSQMACTWINGRLVRGGDLLVLSRRAGWIGLAGAVLLTLSALTGWGGLAGIAVSLLPVIGVTVALSSNLTARMMALYPHNAGAAVAALTASMFGAGALSSLAVSLFNDGTPKAMALVILGCALVSVAGSARWFSAGRTP